MESFIVAIYFYVNIIAYETVMYYYSGRIKKYP